MDLNDQIVELRDNETGENGKPLTFREIGERVGLTKGKAAARYYYAKKTGNAGGVAGGVKRETSAPVAEEICFEIIGVGPDVDLIPPEQLWQGAIEAQTHVLEILKRRRREQKIILPVPGALAFLSDLHFGSPFTDYQAAKSDAEIIRDTPDMKAGFIGDGVDNWIVGKLAGLQRHQAITFDAEWQLFFSWLEILNGSMAFVVSGNHDNWTRKIAGVDRIREYLRGTMLLYHSQQVKFDLVVGPQSYVVKARHKWKGSSVFNPTHGLEVGWERGGDDFDIALGGHTHIGTYCRPFDRHDRRRLAILIGTYKVADEHGEEIGVAPSQGRGCGALVFDKDGDFVFVENLNTAAQYLEFLKSSGGKHAH